MIILIVTLKNKLITNVVAWTHSCFWVGAILLLQFRIDLLVYYCYFYFMLHILFSYFYLLYLNTFTISLSPPTSWLHLFNIPVSEKPHFSMTLPMQDSGEVVCPDIFEMLLVDAVVEHQFQGFGADPSVPVSFPYPVTHLTVVFSDRDVAGFMSVVADAADSLAN